MSGNASIEWKGIGVWRVGSDHKIIFEPGIIKNQLKALVAEKIIRSEA